MAHTLNSDAMKSLIVSASNGTSPYFIKISWESLIGINKYEISRSISETGPFRLIKSVNVDPINQPPFLHLYDKGAQTEKTYHYRVTAYSLKGFTGTGSDNGYRCKYLANKKWLT